MKLAIILGFVVAAMVGLFAFAGGGGSNSTTASPTVAPGNFDQLVGKPAPDFTLSSYDGKQMSLNSLKGKKVVLFFNEGLICYPACWNQIAALGSDARLNTGQIVTASVVVNSDQEWKTAVAKMPELGKETMLLDTDKVVSNQYGVLELPSSMHKGLLPGHTYIILDKTGVVRWTSDDPKMAVNNDELIRQLEKF
jgi:peroxiredoxin